MTANPSRDKIAQFLEDYLVSCEFDEEEISPEELAEADAAHQDYLSGRVEGKSLRQVRRELLSPLEINYDHHQN